MQARPKFRRLVLGPAVPGGTCSFGFSGGADRTSSAAANSSRNVGAKSYAVKTEPGARGQADPKQASADRTSIDTPPAADQKPLLSRLPGELLKISATPGEPPRPSLTRENVLRTGPPSGSSRSPIGQDRRACRAEAQAMRLAVQAGDLQTARAGPPPGVSTLESPATPADRPRPATVLLGAKLWWGRWPLRDCHLGRAAAPRIETPPASNGRGAERFFLNLEQPWTRCPRSGTPSCFTSTIARPWAPLRTTCTSKARFALLLVDAPAEAYTQVHGSATRRTASRRQASSSGQQRALARPRPKGEGLSGRRGAWYRFLCEGVGVPEPLSLAGRG